VTIIAPLTARYTEPIATRLTARRRKEGPVPARSSDTETLPESLETVDDGTAGRS